MGFIHKGLTKGLDEPLIINNIIIDYEYLEEKANGKCPKCGEKLIRIEQYDSIEISDMWNDQTNGYDDTIDKDYGDTLFLKYECSNNECDFKYVYKDEFGRELN